MKASRRRFFFKFSKSHLIKFSSLKKNTLDGTVGHRKVDTCEIIKIQKRTRKPLYRNR